MACGAADPTPRSKWTLARQDALETDDPSPTSHRRATGSESSSAAILDVQKVVLTPRRCDRCNDDDDCCCCRCCSNDDNGVNGSSSINNNDNNNNSSGGRGGSEETEEEKERPSASELHVGSRDGDVETVRRLIEAGESVNCQFREGRTRAITPLNLAVRRRRFDVAQLLLEAGARVDICEEALARKEGTWLASYSPLHWAVENGDEPMAELLLSRGSDCNARASLRDHRGVTPLHLAAQDGNGSMCRLLLSRPDCLRDPVKSTPRRNMITPLHQAAFNGHCETVRLLVSMGCDPNRQADNGYAALHYACQIGDSAMVEAILDRGGRHDLRSFTEVQSLITPLHLAVQSADEATVRLLVARGADLEAEKRLGKVGGVTPLQQAVHQNKLEIVRLLIELGSDVNAKSGRTWYTALHVAAERGSPEMLDLLLSPSVAADPNARASLGDHSDVTPLHVASQCGRNAAIRRLARAGADVDCRRRYGKRSGVGCLHLAVEAGHADSVKLLVGLGCSVNAVDSLKYTPLHSAVQHRRLDAAKTLLAADGKGRCNVKLKNNTGLTAKQMAKAAGATSAELVGLFRDREGSDARRIKSRRSKSAVFKYLCGL